MRRMSRYELTDSEWRVIEPLLPNKPRGVPRVDDRRVLNGIFWVLLNSGSTIFLLDPHIGGDGLVMVIRHRDPDKTRTIRHPSSWRPNCRRRQGLAVDGPTVRRRTAHGLESEWRER